MWKMWKFENIVFEISTFLHDNLQRSIALDVKCCFQIRIKVVMTLKGSKISLNEKRDVKYERKKCYKQSPLKNSFL